MLKWTLPVGVLLVLACSGELPELPSASSETREDSPPAMPVPSTGAPVSTGQDAPPVDAIPAVVRICEHDEVQEMVEHWGQRASTPAGISRLCQAQYMDWKSDLDTINPALSEGIFETLADCLEVPSPQWEQCYADYLMELEERLGRLPPMPGAPPEEIAAQEGPQALIELCVAFVERWGEEGFAYQPGRLTKCVSDSAPQIETLQMLLGKKKTEQLMDDATRCVQTTPLQRNDDSGFALLNQCMMQLMESVAP